MTVQTKREKHSGCMETEATGNKTYTARLCGRFRLSALLTALLICLCLYACAGTGKADTLNMSGVRNIRLSVDPTIKDAGFTAVVYNNRNGLPTSEANAITQTAEGFIWIGSYAGLIRYDGNNFMRIDPSSGIANVRSLFVDSKGRLWVGTNDSGLFLLTDGNWRGWSSADGLPTNSIRSIAEDSSGNIYASGEAGIAVLDTEFRLRGLRDERLADTMIQGIRTGEDGKVYGLTAGYDVFALKDGEVAVYIGHDECAVGNASCILPDPANAGYVYLATEESKLYYGSLENGLDPMTVYDVSPLIYPTSCEMIDGSLWVCGGNGMGKLDRDGFHMLEHVPMDNLVGKVMTDHEGNLWFTSTRQGVMKVVPNHFLDLFERYGIESTAVNSTCLTDGRLFIATDTGLIVMENESRMDALPLTGAVTASGEDLGVTDLISYLNGVRIRSIIRDSRDRLWLCTWRKCGLLCYDHGALTAYTEQDGLFSGQVRTVSEMEDGTILVANLGGLTLIRDGKVVSSIGEKDGLTNTSVLTVTEGFDHEIVMGTDGGGIFVFSGEGTRHIGEGDGLLSGIILRLKKSRNIDVYWIVTSNSLAYMTPDLHVTTVKNFPYSNNYDLYESSTGDLWVLSSAGVYVSAIGDLIRNGEFEPSFFGVFSGLPYVATVNSYSDLTAGGDLYIAGTGGVIRTNIEQPFEGLRAMNIDVPYVDADGLRIERDKEGVFHVPSNTRKLTIYSYVFSYSLSNPRVNYRLDGFEPAFNSVERNELGPVVYTNLPGGSFNFILRVSDLIGHTGKTASFRIVKADRISAGAAGSIIMDAASLFFLGGLLVYTSLYRKRGRLDDRLFFVMIITNMVMAVVDAVSYITEGIVTPRLIRMMYLENIVFYAAFCIFAYLFCLYTDFRVYRDERRLRPRKLWYGIPCLLLIALLFVNLWTGWLYTVDADNIYHAGPYNDLVFVPVIICFASSLFKIRKISPNLVLLGIVLLVTRVLFGVAFRQISSTAMTYTLFLVCAHLYTMNTPINEEKA